MYIYIYIEREQTIRVRISKNCSSLSLLGTDKEILKKYPNMISTHVIWPGAIECTKKKH